MLGPAEFKTLKQTNVSKDAEKTKQRGKEIWASIPKPQREEILSLIGLTTRAVSYSYLNGSITAKIVLGIAQVLKVNPYFLTGQSDEREGYSEDVVRQFLTESGYEKLAGGEEKPKRKYKPRQTAASSSAENTAVESAPEPKLNNNVPVNNEIQAEEPRNETTPAGDLNTQPEAALSADVPAVNEVIAENSRSDVIPSDDLPAADYDALLTKVQKKITALTKNEQDKLNSISDEDAKILLKALCLRAAYSKEAKVLATLIKLMLTL